MPCSPKSTEFLYASAVKPAVEQGPRDGNGSVGYGSWVKWVSIFGWVKWVVGHCPWPIDRWWWNNCAVACKFLFLVDIKKLLIHSISPNYHSYRLNFNLHFLLSRPRGLSSTTMPRPLLFPCTGRNDVTNGHGSWVMGHVSTMWWVTWVMGHERWPISISARTAEDLCQNRLHRLL